MGLGTRWAHVFYGPQLVWFTTPHHLSMVLLSLIISGTNFCWQNEDDGGGGLEDTEESYDALNSETFGSAINGDWENIHEDLVRLDRRASEIKDDHGESDLGKSSLQTWPNFQVNLTFPSVSALFAVLNLSRVGMNDFDVAKEDSEGRIQLDPSVWASPFKPSDVPAPNNANDAFFYPNPDAFLRQHFSNPFAPPTNIGASTSSGGGSGSSAQMMQQHQQMLHHQHHQQQQHSQMISHHKQMLLEKLHQKPFQPPPSPAQQPAHAPMKILSVEDIERNIRNQQQQPPTPPKGDAIDGVASRSQTPLNSSSHHNQRQQPSPSGPMSMLRSGAAVAAATNGAPPPNLNGTPGKAIGRMPPGFAALSPMMSGPPPPNNLSPLPMHPNSLPPSGHRPPMPPPHFPVSR